MKGMKNEEAIKKEEDGDYQQPSDMKLWVILAIIIVVNIPVGICYCLVKEWKTVLGLSLFISYIFYMSSSLKMVEKH
jgi:hypothetical protein